MKKALGDANTARWLL